MSRPLSSRTVRRRLDDLFWVGCLNSHQSMDDFHRLLDEYVAAIQREQSRTQRPSPSEQT